MAEETQDGQKTIVAFVVGLLIGGMLVWAFSGPTADAPETQTEDDEASQTSGSDEGTTGDSSDSMSGDSSNATDNGSDEPAPALQVGEGRVNVNDQEADLAVELDSAIYPVSEGWIGVREYNNDQLGYILGVARFSESQGLIPSEIALLRATTPGNRYAIVIFTEDGDRKFSLANDAQIDQIFDTFVAQ